MGPKRGGILGHGFAMHVDLIECRPPPPRGRRRLGAVAAALGASVALHALMLDWASLPDASTGRSASPPPVSVLLLPTVPAANPPAQAAPAASMDTRKTTPRRTDRPKQRAPAAAANRPPAAATESAPPPAPQTQNSVAASPPAGDIGLADVAFADLSSPAGPDHGSSGATAASAHAQIGAEPAADAARASTEPEPRAEAGPDVAPAAPPVQPSSVELRFEGFIETAAGDSRIASARFSLTHEDGRYQMTLAANGPLSWFAYTSQGRFGSEGFVPERFTEKRNVVFRSRVDRSIEFEPSAPGQAPGGEQRNPSQGAQDRLSVLLQLCWLARAHPDSMVAGHEFSLPFASKNGVELASFRVGRAEAIAVGDRFVWALRISRVKKAPDAPGIDVWLSDDAQRLPLGVRYEDRDRAVRFVVAESR